MNIEALAIAACNGLDFRDRDGDWILCTAELTRFAALIRAQALEEGAQEFDRRDARNPGVGFYEPQEPAEILRALKDKP